MFKNTAFYNYNGQNEDKKARRSGGWSESVWSSGVDDTNDGPLTKLINARLSTLPPTVTYVGFRISDGEKQKISISEHETDPGTLTAADGSDISQLAVQLHANTEHNVLRFVLKAIPDPWVKGGALAMPNKDFREKIKKYLTELGSGNWFTPVRKVEAQRAEIISITAPGVLTLAGAVGNDFAIGKFVNILRPKTQFRRTAQKYRIADISNDRKTVTVIGWDGGIATKGAIRFAETAFVQYPTGLQKYHIDFVTAHKMGAPFFTTRGRRKSMLA